MTYLPPPIDLVSMLKLEFEQLLPVLEQAGYVFKGNLLQGELYHGRRCVGEVFCRGRVCDIFLEPDVIKRLGLELPKPLSAKPVPEAVWRAWERED